MFGPKFWCVLALTNVVLAWVDVLYSHDMKGAYWSGAMALLCAFYTYVTSGKANETPKVQGE
jgi:hypothetical protein